MKIAGGVFVLAGVLALVFPLLAGLTIELFLGIALAVSGGAQLFETIRSAHLPDRTGHFLAALIFVLGGFLLLAAPMVGIAAFTLLISISFILQGLIQFYFALSGVAPANRVWMLLSGALGIGAGALILLGWPSSAQWLVGTLAGINLVFAGIALLTVKLVDPES